MKRKLRLHFFFATVKFCKQGILSHTVQYISNCTRPHCILEMFTLQALIVAKPLNARCKFDWEAFWNANSPKFANFWGR